MQSDMKEVLKQHLSAVIQLAGVTEELAGVTSGNVIMKGHKVAKAKVRAFLAGDVIVTGVGKEAAERVWVRGAARCTRHQIFEAKKQLH